MGVHRVRKAARKFLDRGNSVRNLKELTPAERDHLAQGGLNTRKALAARVARDGLEESAGESIDPVHLRDALAYYSLDELKGRTRPLPLRFARQAFINWRELVLLSALVLCAFGIRRAAGRPERVVVAARDLAPFELIRLADVKEQRTEAGFGTFESADSVAGRFSLQALSAGDPIARARLSRVRFDDPSVLRDRRVVALPVTRHSAALAIPGSRVLLLFSSTEPGNTAAPVIDDGIVLSARAAGDTSSVVVAVTAGAFNTLKPLLGRSLITVVQQPVVSAP